VADEAFHLAADPTLTYVPPEAKGEGPHINFAPIQNAVDHLDAASARYDGLLASSMEHGGPNAATQTALNGILRGIEQRMTRPEGLPRRPWFRHQIYAPGFWTGYGVKTLPGVREGIEERAWDEVELFVGEIAAALDRVSDGLDEASGLLEGGGSD